MQKVDNNDLWVIVPYYPEPNFWDVEYTEVFTSEKTIKNYLDKRAALGGDEIFYIFKAVQIAQPIFGPTVTITDIKKEENGS